MVTREDVESLLMRLDQGVEEVEPGMWVLGSHGGGIVVLHSPPLLLLRSRVMEVPEAEARSAALFRRLLELNATDLVHGAYAIEEGDVILTDTLELEDLSFHALQASIDALQVALATHLETLASHREG